MEFAELNTEDVRLRIRFRPGSPTILFLHGLAGHGGEWKQVYEVLDEGIGVIAPDQRAHGESWDGVDVVVDRSAYVNDSVSLIRQLATGPVLVVGQSMGGVVATFLAARRPDLVNHLVLIETGIRPLSEADFEALKSWFRSWPATFAGEEEAERFFGQGRPSTPAWVDGLAKTPNGLVRRFDPETMLRTMSVLAGSSRAVEWRQISAPTTLIRAAVGAISDDEIAEMVAVRPTTRAIEIEDSGHDVHLDQPERVATVLAGIVEGGL